MENYKIKVNNEAESKEAQELFFELGYKFEFCADIQSCRQSEAFRFPYFVQATEFGQILFAIGNLDKAQELTLPQLRDLVVLHRNDVKDATHACDCMNGAAIKLSGIWYGYNYFVNKWQPWDEVEDDEYKISDLKPIQKSLEQGLISGADALRALADGDQVQWMTGDVFQDVTDEWQIREFSHPSFKFRLKPRTIKLELEIPAPFEPKVGDIYYYINSSNLKGYGFTKFANDGDDECLTFYGAWRTEEEIKQVVAALRGGIKA